MESRVNPAKSYGKLTKTAKLAQQNGDFNLYMKIRELMDHIEEEQRKKPVPKKAIPKDMMFEPYNKYNQNSYSDHQQAKKSKVKPPYAKKINKKDLF